MHDLNRWLSKGIYASALVFLFFIVSNLAFVSSLSAQDGTERYSISFQATPLIDALKEVLLITEIDLVYSRELVVGQQVFCRAKDATASELLQCVLKETNLDYVLSSSGTFILMKKREVKPLYGDLGGGVYDIDTGAPLPFANILLVNRSGGVATNQDGLFSVSSLISGELPIAVSYIGYESLYDTVLVRPGLSNRHKFFLKANTTEFDPIIINGLMQRVPSSLLGAGEIGPRELGEVVGLKTADVLRGASRLVGVSVQQPIADLHIHGAAGNEHVTLLDGVPVRNPVSMGRHLGAFSPLALERLTLRKTGFASKYGSQLTGVVSVEHNLSAKKSFSNAFTVDPVSTNGRVMGKFKGKNDQELVVTAAARISNWNVYEDQDVRSLLTGWNDVDPLAVAFWVRREVSTSAIQRFGGQPEVQFSDLHFASRYKLNAFHQIHASLYRTTNNLSSIQGIVQQDLEPGNEDDFVLLAQNAYTWLNWAGQIRHSWLLGARSVMTTQVKGSSHNSSLNYQAFFDGLEFGASLSSFTDILQQYGEALQTNIRADEGNKIHELGVQLDFSHSISPVHILEFGVEATHDESSFSFFQPFIDPFENHASTWKVAGYIQDTVPLGKRFVLVPGIRLTYVSKLAPIYAEPRLALRMDGAAPGLGEYAFRLSGGLYRQFIHQFELTGYGTSTVVPYALFWMPLDGSISPSRAYHLAFDALWLPGSHWTLRMEMYSKWLERGLVFDYATIQDLEPDGVPVSQSDFIAPSDGYSGGMGIGLEYNKAFFKGEATYEYAYGKQRFPGRFDERRVTTPWNVPHQISFNMSLQLHEQVLVESNWVQQLGRSWGFRKTYYDVFDIWSPETSISLPDFQDPGNDSLPAYQRFDLGMKYVWQGKGFRSQLRLGVLNMLGRDNVYDYSVEAREDSFSRVPRTLPGRQFSLSVRVDY